MMHFLIELFLKKKKKSESVVAQSCLTLWDAMNCSPPGSSAHGISQVRILEWVAVYSQGDLSKLEIQPASDPPKKPEKLIGLL